MNPSLPPQSSLAGSLFDVDRGKAGIPAATLVIFGDDDDDGDARLLFVERTEAMRFAPGAVVFPGGRVDPADVALGRTIASTLDSDDAGARVAAIRETIEETGLVIGLRNRRDDVREDWRDALAKGVRFADLLEREGAVLDLARLVPFARWDPRFKERRAFDTRFYIASLGGTGDAVSPDGNEALAAFWTSARSMLRDIAAGARKAIFPTLRNLERLAQCPGFADAAANAQSREMRTITPWIDADSDGEWLCIVEGQGYPVTRVRVDRVQRE